MTAFEKVRRNIRALYVLAGILFFCGILAGVGYLINVKWLHALSQFVLGDAAGTFRTTMVFAMVLGPLGLQIRKLLTMAEPQNETNAEKSE